MKRNQLYLSTIAADAGDTARHFGVGIEIAKFATAWFLDDEFPEADIDVRKTCENVENTVLHAPFNELFPCAIDRKARALAADRYRQAIALAKSYGAKKVIIHGGYNPWIYYPVWYVEQSVAFWKNFLAVDPGVEIVLENVLEETPDMLLDIVAGVNHPSLKLCLDIGHVNAYSKVTAGDWIKTWAPHLTHFHIHNNAADQDSHQALSEGSMDIPALLKLAENLCENVTFTLELLETNPSVRYLLEENILI